MVKFMSTLGSGYELRDQRLQLIAISFLIFLPKYSIITFSGYMQGVRLDDIICILVGITTVLNRNSIIIWPIRYVISYCYLVMVMVVMGISGIKQEWIVLVRGMEYFLLAQIFYHSFYERVSVLRNILIIYIVANTLIGILQHYGYVGGFSSYAYLPAGHPWLERAYGLAGGPWEFGLTLIIALHILMRIEHSVKILIFLNVLVMLDLIIAETRANIFGYIISLLIYYRGYIKKKFFYVYLCIFLSILVILNIDLNDRFNNILLIIEKIINYNGDYKSILNIDLSLSQRLDIWSENYNIWSISLVNGLLGIGWHSLYMESLILRLLFTFGLIGTVIIAFMYKGVDKSILALTLIAGLTLDLFLSMKIFLFYLIYAEISRMKSGDYEKKVDSVCT